MKTEAYFLIYAYPAIESCANLTEIEIKDLEEMVLKKEAPPKEKLMEMVPNAFKRMKNKLGEDYWTNENVKEYWWIEHNKIIDNNEEGYENALMEHKEVCKVGFWEVIDIKDKIVTIKNKEKKTAKAFNYRNLNLSKQDYITTHKGHVIENISFEEYKKYG